MALSGSLNDLIKINKLAITLRDTEHTLPRSQTATQMWTAKSSLRMCPAFSKWMQGHLTNLTDLWCSPGWGICVPSWAPSSPKLLVCMLSLPWSTLFCPESRVNNLWYSTYFSPTEYYWNNVCKNAIWKSINFFVNQKILFSSCRSL